MLHLGSMRSIRLQVSIYILFFAGHLQMAQFNSWSPREHSKTVSPVLSIHATFNVFKHKFAS